MVIAKNDKKLLAQTVKAMIYLLSLLAPGDWNKIIEANHIFCICLSKKYQYTAIVYWVGYMYIGWMEIRKLT